MNKSVEQLNNKQAETVQNKTEATTDMVENINSPEDIEQFRGVVNNALDSLGENTTDKTSELDKKIKDSSTQYNADQTNTNIEKVIRDLQKIALQKDSIINDAKKKIEEVGGEASLEKRRR